MSVRTHAKAGPALTIEVPNATVCDKTALCNKPVTADITTVSGISKTVVKIRTLVVSSLMCFP